MKKLIIAVALSLIATSSFAGGHRDRGRWQGHSGYNHSSNRWVAPVILGGVVGYTLARPARPEYTSPVVYVERPQCYRVVFYDSYGNFIREEQRCN